MIGFPLLLIPFAIYNIFVFLMPGVAFTAPITSVPLMSGVQWAPTFGDALLAGALELRRVFHRAGADDRALAGHQPRHRVHGADGAGVGQRDRHAGEVLGGELAVAGAPHDVLVGGDELAELHCLATLDGRDDELAHSSIRFGLGRFNTQEEVEYVAARVIETVKKLRELSPLYEMAQEGVDLKTVNWARE